MSEAGKGLAGQALAALKWNYGGALARVGTQILIGIVLARILGPTPFGLVAIAWLVISLCNLVADFGFGAALVQRQDISENEVRYVFTVQMLIGVGLTLLIASSADLIAQVFNYKELVPVLRVLSLVFVIQALGQTATNLLKRNLDFKSLQIAQVVSYLVSYILLGIPLAYMGFEVWSLVIAQLSQSLLQALLNYFRVRHPIKPLFRSHAVGFLSFGTKIITINLVNWSISNLDNVFVGKFFGAANLGLYSRVYNFMLTAVTNVVTVLQAVLFPLYSKAQDDKAMLKQGYLVSVGVVSLIMLPTLGSVAVVPHTVIEGLYGNRWLGAVPLLVPLALAMPFDAAMGMAGPLLCARGKPERELRVQAMSAAFFIVVMLVTSKVSLLALTWGVFGVYVVRFVLMTREVMRMVGASWYEILLTLQGSFLMLAGTALAVSGMDVILLSYSVSSWIRLLSDVFAAAVVAIFLFLAFPRVVLSKDVIWALNRGLNQVPPRLRWLLVHINR